MNILTALWRKLRIASNKSAAAITNPVDEAALNIEDSVAQVGAFRASLTRAMAQKNRMGTELAAVNGDIAKYDRIARLAVQANSDADASEALTVKARKEARKTVLEQEIARNTTVIDNQREQLRRAEEKIEGARNNKDILAVRLEGAEMRKQMAGDTSLKGLKSLDGLQSAVDQAEAEASATEELSGAGQPDLEDKYSPDHASVADRLAKLKAELAPAPAK